MSTVFTLYPGVVALDLFGPFDALALADEYARAQGLSPPFQPVLAAAEMAPVRLASGPRVLPDKRLQDTHPTRVVVPGSVLEGTQKARSEVATWLQGLNSGQLIQQIGICTGAFILAEAGLLEGKRATTHWARSAGLAEAYPGVDVQADALYVEDAGTWTSAGVTAGIDLAIALIRQELGPKPALKVARQLVVFAHRPGSQSQFSALLQSQTTEDDRLYELQHWVLGHLQGDLSINALAARVSMSPRNFARRFREQVGMTPGAFVQRARLDAARSLLEGGSKSMAQVAERCGIASEEVLRRLFQRHLHVSPQAYRRRFAHAQVGQRLLATKAKTTERIFAHWASGVEQE